MNHIEASYEKQTGHWMLKQRDKCIDVCCSVCGYARVEEYAYNYTTDQLDKQDIQKFYKESNMNFCENCGAKMEIDKLKEDKNE